MPDRHRHAKHIPPNALDHILAHPAELVLSAWWVFIGVWLANLFIDPEKDSIPYPLIGGMALAFIVGGLLVIAGVLWWGTRLTTAWAIERAGWVLAGTGRAAYFIAGVYIGFSSMVGLSVGLTMSLIAILRVCALYSLERQVRKDVALAEIIDDNGESP